MPVANSSKVAKPPRAVNGSSGPDSASSPKADLAKEGTLGPVPPPLPKDPAVRAELRQRLERGIASARAGIGEDWEVVHARVRARLNLPPL
jgi:hypothetical protein